MTKEQHPMPADEEQQKQMKRAMMMQQGQRKTRGSKAEVSDMLLPGQSWVSKTLTFIDDSGELFRELPSRPIIVRPIERLAEQVFSATSTDPKQFFALSQRRLCAEAFTPEKMSEGISQLRKSLFESEGAQGAPEFL